MPAALRESVGSMGSGPMPQTPTMWQAWRVAWIRSIDTPDEFSP